MLNIFLCIFTLMVFGISSSAFAEDHLFTNKDLDRYKGVSNGFVYRDRGDSVLPSSASDSGFRYWCSLGRSCEERIVDARRSWADAEGKLLKVKSDDFWTASGGSRVFSDRKSLGVLDAEKSAIAAKAELVSAEHSLLDLKERARIEDIPSGWLRCQP